MNLNYYELKPEDNRFATIFVDLTHKCNMKCANCYLPNRTIADMDKSKLFDLLKRLPFRCHIRLVGAEPTMRPDLPEIIYKVRQLKHHPMLVTNGLKLSDKNYTLSLKQAGLVFVCLSLNGGDDDSLYKAIDGMSCAKLKMQALENIAEMNFCVNTGTILIKGLNEKVPLILYSKLKALKVKKALMRFRNVGQIGRRMIPNEKNYTFPELLKCVLPQLGVDKQRQGDLSAQSKNKKHLYFHLDHKEGGDVYVKITDWLSDESSCPDPNNKTRGRVTEDFKIAPFFEHVKRNEFGY